MNEQIRKLALDAGLFNYVDNETPRRYFIDGYADLEEVKKFSELIIMECAEFARQHNLQKADRSHMIHQAMKEHFGVGK